MKRKSWLGMCIAVAACTTTMAEAAMLKEGVTACRNQKALTQLQLAEAKGDKRTVGWLFDGAVCVTVPKDTEVRVLARTEDGIQQLKTINRRRNIELWTLADAIKAPE